jgi:hypothetical protein
LFDNSTILELPLILRNRIKVGKQADIIILSANPEDDISNTKKIEAAMDEGRFVDRKMSTIR